MGIDNLAEAARSRLCRAVLGLVDTKLLLGYWYADRVYGTPSMEDMNAIQGQAANEFGQAKHLRTALQAFDVDTEALDRRSEPAEFYSASTLDDAPATWPGFLATIGITDAATQIRMKSFAEGTWQPAAEPAAKALQEEEFHTQFLIGALEADIAPADEARAAFVSEFDRVLPEILGWFGPTDEAARQLAVDHHVTITPDQERELLLGRLRDLDESIFDGALPLAHVDTGFDPSVADIEWDPARGRPRGGPSPTVIDRLAIGGIEASLGKHP